MLQTPPSLSEIDTGDSLVIGFGPALDKTSSLHTDHHAGYGRRLNPHELPNLLLGEPILVPQVLQKHFLAYVQVIFTQIFLETDAVNMGQTRNQQAVGVIDFTVAHLVLQNYVADYINIPCFGTSVKWTCSEPVRSMNGLHDQKSLKAALENAFAALPPRPLAP